MSPRSQNSPVSFCLTQSKSQMVMLTYEDTLDLGPIPSLTWSVTVPDIHSVPARWALLWFPNMSHILLPLGLLPLLLPSSGKFFTPYPHGWLPSSFRSLFKLPPRWGIPQPTCWRFRPLTSGCISLFLAFSFLPDTYHHLPPCLFTFLIMFITPSLCLFYSQFISHACNSAWHTIRIWQVIVEWMNLLEHLRTNWEMFWDH